MSILQFSPVKVGQVGVKPATYKMVSNNTLAEITAAGFLKQGTGGQFLERNDVIQVIASIGTPLVKNVDLYVTIDTNGIITLNEDVAGGLGESALKAVTNNALPNVASVSGSFVLGRLLKAADVAGTVQDAGFSLKAVSNQAVAGGSPAFTVTDAFCDANTTVSVEFKTQTNPASILKVFPGVGSFNVTASADPGASSIMYSLIK